VASLGAESETATVFAYTCLGYCTSAAQASKRMSPMHHWGKKHTGTVRRQERRMATWNVLVMSLASWRALKPWPGAAGGVRGC
jgi:hypothetical protein